MLAQPLFVDRLEADEHVFEAELTPETEHLLVAQQHVAASFEIILLADTGTDDRLGDLHAVPLLHKRHVINDEGTRFAYRPEVLDDTLRADHAIAAAIEGPRAAEGAVPRATPRELYRSAGVESAQKIFPAMAQQ